MPYFQQECEVDKMVLFPLVLFIRKYLFFRFIVELIYLDYNIV
jgi:hypothetical protein